KILPSFPVLIKFADYFNVSTDYLLGRTDDPQGKLYGKPFAAKEQINDFIEMCFDPTTEANAKLKEAMRKIMSEQNKKKE
ncbi:MAG: transcriptional regulator, partial [Clostridiales bacterium]|nr:transcriptional regulator [Clostridiales bacterium]